MKPIGKLTVSSKIKFTLPLLELFCIPTINKRNKQELNNNINNILFNNKDILSYFF